jgi:hypothetical protein
MVHVAAASTAKVGEVGEVGELAAAEDQRGLSLYTHLR